MARIALVAFCLLAPPSAQVALAEPVLIEGVEQVGRPAKHFDVRMSALTAALHAMGCPATYEQLMVTSGAAFLTVWSPGHSSATVLTATPEDFLVAAAGAVGAKAERRSFETEEEMRVALRESIDQGRPIVAPGHGGAQVICGYETDNPTLHSRFGDSAREEYDTTPRRSVFDGHKRPGAEGLLFLEYDPASPRPELDWPSILKRAISYADWPVDQKLRGSLTCGLPAYDEWAETLRSGGGPEGAIAAYMVSVMHAAFVGRARGAAATALGEAAGVNDAFSAAALHYRAEANSLQNIVQVLHPGGGPNQGIEQAVWDESAAIVEAAKAEEVQAVDALRRALNVLEPPPTAPAVVEQPAGSPQELCARARELKAAKQHAEAAKVLAAAIAQDPNYVEAHWILAWVFADLDDKAGAAAAFRKVIDLSPDSEWAREAKQALERLGH